MLYFRFLAIYQLIMPLKQWHCASPAPLTCCTSPAYPPPSWRPVFGWLLHNKSSIGGRLRPKHILYFYFSPLHLTPQTMGQRPPHVLPRFLRLLSNVPSTVNDNFWLVVVSLYTLTARGLEERRNFEELLIKSVGHVHFS
jgi:hypothetical protein